MSSPSDESVALLHGASSLADQVAERLSMDGALREIVADAFRRWATQGWERQRGVMSGWETASAGSERDPRVLLAATKKIFAGEHIPGLAGDLAPLQRTAAFEALVLVGLADCDEASDSLIVHLAGGGVVIVETLPVLFHMLHADDPARAVITAATDTVMWGAAVAITEAQLRHADAGSVSAGERVTAMRPEKIDMATAATARPAAVTHVLSFDEFRGAFEAQSALFAGSFGITSVLFTNPSDETLLSMVDAREDDVRSRRFGLIVLLVRGPVAITDVLTETAKTYVGRYEFSGEV